MDKHRISKCQILILMIERKSFILFVVNFRSKPFWKIQLSALKGAMVACGRNDVK